MGLFLPLGSLPKIQLSLFSWIEPNNCVLLDQDISEWPKCGGANGSIRFKPEIGHGANSGLSNGLKLLEPIKQKYPAVSYADLLQMASAVAIEVTLLIWIELAACVMQELLGYCEGRGSAKSQNHLQTHCQHNKISIVNAVYSESKDISSLLSFVGNLAAITLHLCYGLVLRSCVFCYDILGGRRPKDSHQIWST